MGFSPSPPLRHFNCLRPVKKLSNAPTIFVLLQRKDPVGADGGAKERFPSTYKRLFTIGRGTYLLRRISRKKRPSAVYFYIYYVSSYPCSVTTLLLALFSYPSTPLPLAITIPRYLPKAQLSLPSFPPHFFFSSFANPLLFRAPINGFVGSCVRTAPGVYSCDTIRPGFS